MQDMCHIFDDICRKAMSDENNPYKKNQESKGLISEPIATYGSSRIALIRRGLPFKILQEILVKSQLSKQDLETIFQISVRTLQRFEAHQNLSPSLTEKVLELNEIFEMGQDVFGKEHTLTTKWLQEPNEALGKVSPLSLLDTHAGFQQVKQVLGRLMHGVYS